MNDKSQPDLCRVCRCEGTKSKPLFYPCKCTGSIKYIHQECLIRWLEYSKRHTCELCNHRFQFSPIYVSGTPRFLPLNVLFMGLVTSFLGFAVSSLHLTIVFLAWLIIVPLTACRIYRCLFTGSVSSLLTLPLDMLATKHLLQDCIQGFTIVILALAAFLGYVSLREQLLQGGGPEWLERDARVSNEGLQERGPAEANPNRPFFLGIFNLFGRADIVEAADFDEDNETESLDNSSMTSQAQSSSRFSSSAEITNQNIVELNSSIEAEIPGTSNDRNLEEPAMSSIPALQPRPLAWAENQAAPEFDTGVGPEGDGGRAPEENDAAGFAEAMDWEHLLGLDGSFSFLEHVLWLIALNTLFIVTFAFCPYHIGRFTLLGFNLEKVIAATHMEGFLTSVIGYLIFAFVLVIMHQLFNLIHMPKACYWTGLTYVYIKVALVSLLELGIFPALCGFWIDACTLSLFNTTLTHRISVFHYAPIAFTFIHWAMGMLYIFYMASLLILSRSVLRTGVLRFVYHFNDPDYKPIQDMILQPLPIYIQRLVATYSIWGILIVLMLWIPTESIRLLLTDFLPFRVTVAYESPLDYSMEIIVLQVILPFLLDVQAKASLRQLLRLWCVGVALLLGLRSYLLGDVPFQTGDYIVLENGQEVCYSPPHTDSQRSTSNSDSSSTHPQTSVPGTSRFGESNLDQASEEIPQYHPPPQNAEPHADDDDEFRRYVPYRRPSFFKIRIAGLILVVLITLMLMSLLLLIVPVGIGRFTMNLFSTNTSVKHDAVALVGGFTILGFILRLAPCSHTVLNRLWHTLIFLINESTQLMCWSRPLRVLRIWTRWGTTCEITIRRPALPAPMSNLRNQNCDMHSMRNLIFNQYLSKFMKTLLNCLRLACVAAILLIILPSALGLLINLIFMVPLRIGAKKTLIIGFWENWIFGIMHLKVAILLILVGPPWWLRNRLDALQNEIVQHRFNVRTMYIMSAVTPFLVGVGMSLAVPHLLAHHIGPWLGLDPEFAFRYIYPCLFLVFLTSLLLVFQCYRLKCLYTQIKDEKYLIGLQLVNFGQPEHNSTHSLIPIPWATQ